MSWRTAESSGSLSVDAVHGHVVAVVCAPAECELAEVAGADDDASELVGVVHEDLCALARLCVLVCDIGGDAVVSECAEVVGGGLPYGYLDK